MVSAAADLAQFVQRRELMAYEQRLARQAYAYGPDLRRSAWLDHSTFGEPLMRSVDRRWNGLVDDLMADAIERPGKSPPTPIMEEVARIIRLLRAPLPTLRVLKAGTPPNGFPPVTPLGTTKGGIHWLVLDVERLMAVPPHERTFLLGSGLGNLQCDHGPVFAAHLMAQRSGRGLGMVRTLLRPWSRVMVFSADRAGLLSIAELEPTLAALRAHADPGVAWCPALPSASVRVQALEDFDQSRVVTRLRLMYKNRADWTVAPRRKPDPAQQSSDASQSESKPEPEPSAPPEAPSDEETAKHAALAEALKNAWPLARCDSRLTRRLRLF